MKIANHAQSEASEAYVAALLEAGAVKIAPDANHLFTLRNGTESTTRLQFELCLWQGVLSQNDTRQRKA